MLRWLLLIAFVTLPAGCTYRQDEVVFRNGDITLAGTVTLPSGNGPHPAVVFIHGSGPDNRENYRFYADVFARNGLATLIYDKRGVGASTGDWRRIHFKDLAEDALAGVRMLKGRKEIASDKIGLWGGSNGGWVAPLAAALSPDVAFVITVAGAAISPTELAKWRSVNYVKNNGYSDEAVQQVSKLMDLQFELVRKEGWEKGWEKYEAELQQVRNEPWFGRLAALRNAENGSWFLPYTASIDFDPVPIYESLNVPVLAVLGEADALVPARETSVILERIKREKNKDITVAILAGADHNMNRPSGPRPVPEYTETMINWIHQKVQMSAESVTRKNQQRKHSVRAAASAWGNFGSFVEVRMGAEKLYPIIFTLFQVCWASVWAAKHIKIRHLRRYADNRTSADKNSRYKILSYFLYISQNVLCIASFWSTSQLLFKIHNSDSIRIVGVILITYATTLYFRSLNHLGRNYSPCFDSHVPLELICSGPYKFTRHPMYLAKLLVVVGNFVVSGSLWFLLMFVYLAVETTRTVLNEERYLATSVPGYADYKKRTSTMIPFIF